MWWKHKERLCRNHACTRARKVFPVLFSQTDIFSDGLVNSNSSSKCFPPVLYTSKYQMLVSYNTAIFSKLIKKFLKNQVSSSSLLIVNNVSSAILTLEDWQLIAFKTASTETASTDDHCHSERSRKMTNTFVTSTQKPTDNKIFTALLGNLE